MGASVAFSSAPVAFSAAVHQAYREHSCVRLITFLRWDSVIRRVCILYCTVVQTRLRPPVIKQGTA